MKSRTKNRKHLRPLRVYLRPGSKADKGFHSRISMPQPAEIAPGLPPSPDHNLIFHGGNTIADLVFTNFYVGGSDAWDAGDIQNIDQALSAAMSDQRLNNVMVQYYQSGQISSTFRGSQVLAGPPPQTVSQGDVENLVRTLFQAGSLDGFDTSSTVFNFMLPRGTILNTDPAATTSTITAEVEGAPKKAERERPAAQSVPHEEEEDSTNGLGGYHGSVHVTTPNSTQTVYYAVGVFSEGNNGIPVFDQSWKNVVATFYHELNEARTDPDVEDAIRLGDDPSAVNFLGWTSAQGEECGDFPVSEAQPLTQIFQEVELTDQSGTVPIQFQYSNADQGPGEPRDEPAPFAGAAAQAA